MYTPYNMFYPELPKAQVGTEAPPDGKDPVVGERVEMSDGSIYVYTQNADGTFGYVLEQVTQEAVTAAAPTQSTTTQTFEYEIGEILDVDGVKGIVIGYTDDGKAKLKKLDPSDPILLKGKHKDFTKDYAELEKALNIPEVKKAIWEEYQKSNKSYKIKKAGEIFKNVKDPDELIKRYLKTQKAIMLINANNSREEIEALDLDKSVDNRNKILADYGIEDLDLVAFQKAFYDIKDVAESNAVAKPVRDVLKTFNWSASGDPDDDSQTVNNSGKGSGSISNIDAILGNNAIQQTATLKPEEPVVVKTEEKGKNTGGKIPTGDWRTKGNIPEVGMFPQDENNILGALVDSAKIKKYLPKMANATFAHYDPTFYDPSALNADIMGQANIGTQGLNASANPQAYMAGYSQLQANASREVAANTANVNNLNVGVANDAAKYNAEVDTKQALYNAQKNGNYYDQTTIANQQFDNSKTLARHNATEAWNTAITNQAMANTLNYMHPNEFYLDPRTGGRIRFNPDNLASLDNNYKSDYERRSGILSDIMQDKKWTGQDPFKIYETLYPSENSPGNYKKPNQESDKSTRNADMMRMLSEMFGHNTNPSS